MADEVPDLLTMDEAARAMRVGRTKIYAMAREWRVTGGRSGLPVVDLGHTLRVPRQALEEILGAKLTAASLRANAVQATSDGNGQVPEPEVAPPAVSEPSPDCATAPQPASRPRSQRAKNASPNQLDLFDSTD